MGDEALNAHLDWLDDCAKEQGGEKMKPKMREQILGRHNKLVDSGRTAWTTVERDRCRLLDYVAQLERVARAGQRFVDGEIAGLIMMELALKEVEHLQ